MGIADDLVQYYWIDGDDNTFYLSPDTTNSRYLMEVDGLGLPGVERFVAKKTNDHGQTKQGWRYTARAIDLVVAFRASTRSGLWTAMGDWASAFNAERGTGTLKMVLPDGTERRIDCDVSDRIPLGSRERRGALVQVVAIALTADDPMLYNPSQQSASDNFDGANAVDITCENSGDVKTWASIEIAGEVVNPVLTHIETGDTLTFTYTVAGGTTVYINGEAGTVALGDGTSLMDKIETTDDFLKLLTGTNTVRLTATSGTSACTVKWYERDVALHA